MKKPNRVRSFRFTPEDVRQLEAFKKSLKKTFGEVTDLQAIRAALVRANQGKSQKEIKA